MEDWDKQTNKQKLIKSHFMHLQSARFTFRSCAHTIQNLKHAKNRAGLACDKNDSDLKEERKLK